MVAILGRLYEDQDTPLSTVVSETYHDTLAQWHGWLVSNTFAVRGTWAPLRW